MNKKIFIALEACQIQGATSYFTTTYFDIEKISYIKEYEENKNQYCYIASGGLQFRVKAGASEVLSKLEKSDMVDISIVRI
jgi:hypothetical protein